MINIIKFKLVTPGFFFEHRDQVRAIPSKHPCWGHNSQIAAETLSEEHLLLLTRCLRVHKGFESEKVKKKGLLKVLKKVSGKKKDF